MGCKGKCDNHSLRVNHGGREGVGFGGMIYKNGIKRCGKCEVYFKTDNIFCPCCGLRMRYKPKNADGRTKMVVARI